MDCVLRPVSAHDVVKKAPGSSMSCHVGTTTVISPKPGTVIVAERCRRVLSHPIVIGGSMAADAFKYDHPVKVSAESGELLGTGHFVGEAGINRRTGVSKWSGNLDTDIDPLLLVQAGELRLEFENGAVGYARCPSHNRRANCQRIY